MAVRTVFVRVMIEVLTAVLVDNLNLNLLSLYLFCALPCPLKLPLP